MEQGKNWDLELNRLEIMASSFEMERKIKWGIPVYSHLGKNIVGISAFKNYVGLWFFQGAFLIDKQHLLINAQEGKTKGMRQWRFTNLKQIEDLENEIHQYLQEAINNSKKGLEIKKEVKQVPPIPEEFQMELKESDTLNTNFSTLSLAKRRAYVEYLIDAKRTATLLKRIEKIIPLIIAKKGLNDVYKKK